MVINLVLLVLCTIYLSKVLMAPKPLQKHLDTARLFKETSISDNRHLNNFLHICGRLFENAVHAYLLFGF